MQLAAVTTRRVASGGHWQKDTRSAFARRNNRAMKRGAALQEIVGSRLSAVTFVMDYLQLAFDGPLLTANTAPRVEVGGRVWSSGEPGYRDALCARIASKVVAADIAAETIAITFSDGAVLSVSLRAEDLAGGSAESAVFHGEGLVVFRPGDEDP